LQKRGLIHIIMGRSSHLRTKEEWRLENVRGLSGIECIDLTKYLSFTENRGLLGLIIWGMLLYEVRPIVRIY
jgi:hypothetical protein